ncbi:MAG: gamma-glutamyltransferase [Bacillota bacterium]|nr:MAG: gamma-glutamyltransferase [Bacillota bacterium]
MNGERPVLFGTRGMVVTGHHLATRAAVRVLALGGNAIDAGVAAGLTLGVVHPDMVCLGGVAPILLWPAGGAPVSISGLGRWPRAASLSWYNERFGDRLPEGVLQWVTPAALDAWLTALELYGTLRFADVAHDALVLARDGFAVHPFMAYNLRRQGEAAWRWPENNRLFYGGRQQPLKVGQRFRQPALAALLQRLIDVESRHADREAGIAAVRDYFYKGEPAAAIAEFAREHGGLLTREDLADFRVQVEPVVSATYHDLEIVGCGPWCQGPMLQQILRLLENFDLRSMGHNSPEYIHTVVEAIKLAAADREAWFGDPEFVPVPVAGLLHPEYARQRARLIRPDRAWPELPPAGNPWAFDDTPWGGRPSGARPSGRTYTGPAGTSDPMPDTSFVAVVDHEGNIFTATPSDPATDTPLVPALGLPASSRGRQSRLIPGHPNALEPWKRPRLTPMPAIVRRGGQPWIAFGTPGGDVQPQAMVQVLLNLFHFQMSPQEAVEAPRFATFSFPNSFAPHQYYPGLVMLENRLDPKVKEALEQLGHRVGMWEPWDWRAGGVCAIVWQEDGVLAGAADPRRESYGLGW